MLPTPTGPGVTVVPRYGTNRDVLGLPPFAVTITNSERSNAACDLRWLYGDGLGLKSSRVEIPLSFGAAAHDAMQDLWGWWAATDGEYRPEWFEATCAWCALNVDQKPGQPCPHCQGTTKGPVARAIAKWEADAARQADAWGAEDEDEREDIPRRAERLRRMLDGYLRTYGAFPPSQLRVVGVEVPIARQILGPTGKPYAPEVPLFLCDDGGYRFARPGDDPARVKVTKIPWYYVGVLDLILASRSMGTLFVGEHKFSKAPETLLQGLTNDTQLPGYCWALEGVADDLPLPPEIVTAIEQNANGKRRVGGYVFMVNASGFQYDPPPLKAGGLSVAKNKTVPSWRFEAALEKYLDTATNIGGVKLYQDPASRAQAAAKYTDHIADLRTRDARFYRREPGSVGPIEKARFAREISAIAKRHAQMRREAARISPSNPPEFAFPRTPVCRIAGGACSFRGPCASRTTDATSIAAGGQFVVSDGQRWYPDGMIHLPLPATPAPTPTKHPENPCPF
jgi:hypothetical protein